MIPISVHIASYGPLVVPSSSNLFDLLKNHPTIFPSSTILGAEVNGNLQDMSLPLKEHDQIILLDWTSFIGKQIFWHSTAHLMAEAIQHFYPKSQLSIGPPIEQGYYYDIDFGKERFDSSLIPKIEKRMKKMAEKKDRFLRMQKSLQAAKAYYAAHPNPYKEELIEGFSNDAIITFYQQGNFIDLCKGPHLPHTALIKAIKITHTSAAYWKADASRQQLTRIYGISFPTQELLQSYLLKREEAKKRDHRKIGEKLELFTFSSEVGIGLPLWLPKGMIVRETLIAFLQDEQQKMGYDNVCTPHIGHKRLYVRSGHYDKYKESSFQPIETPNKEESYLLKPMNCPHHCEIYKSKPRSYKELPLRLAEFGTVYRYEQHGELLGLARTRSFTQDDAHIFCRIDQVTEEILKVVQLVQIVFKKMKFISFEAQISIRSDNKHSYIGSNSAWETAEEALQQAAESAGLKTKVVRGEAAFYGPKIDFMIKDSLERRWQLGTVQLDYQLPERFDLTYVDHQNQKQRPIMIHRAPFGSLERFLALLLEHTAGNLPFWLSAVQIALLPISEHFVSYATSAVTALNKLGYRSICVADDEKIGKKIRKQELLKTPLMLIVGEREKKENSYNVRKQGEGKSMGNYKWEELLSLLEEVKKW